MPGTPGYREATAVYNLFAPVQPDEAVIADSADSVAAAITRARSRSLDVEVISTGHASSMADQMSGALLVRTVPSGPVEVDPQTHRARIPAGTRWVPWPRQPLSTGRGPCTARPRTSGRSDRDNPGRWMDEERAAFVDLVRRGIDPDGLFRRGVRLRPAR